MKKVKNKSLKSFLFVMVVFMCSVTFAQPPGGGGQQGVQQGPPPIPNEKQIEKMVSDLATEISLSDEQESSILVLYQDHFKEAEAKSSGNTKPKREEMEALRSDLENSVKALLTDNQKKAYEAYLKKQNSQKQRR